MLRGPERTIEEIKPSEYLAIVYIPSQLSF